MGDDDLIRRGDASAVVLLGGSPAGMLDRVRALPAASAEDVRAGALREAFDAILGPLSEMAGKSTLDITVEWKDGPHKAVFRRNLRPQDVLALIPEARP